LTQIQAADIAVDYADCGDASTHAKVTKLEPRSISPGKTTTVTGTGTLDEDVADATFEAVIKAFGKQVASCKGDGSKDVVCKLPAGTGSITLKAQKFPLKKGTVSLPVDINLKAGIPASLAKTTTHVTAKSSNGHKLVCLDVKTKKASSVEDASWEEWKAEYGRTYNGDDEEQFRRAVFEENLQQAAVLQEENPEAEFGATQFSDWTPEEMKALLNYEPNNSTLPEFDFDQTASAPNSIDWTGKATTPVKDQGQCGSCWAFSAVEQIESDLMLQHGASIELAPQELVDCTSRGAGSRRNGCQGGFPSAGYQVIEALGGIEKESDYRYTARNGVCRYSRSRAAVTVTDYHSVGQGSESTMKQYVGTNGPLSVCVDANSWNSYRGGVMTSCGRSVDHCVQVVGYGESGASSYWKVRNSWGSRWGESGHIRLRIGQNLCAIDSSPSRVSASLVGDDTLVV